MHGKVKKIGVDPMMGSPEKSIKNDIYLNLEIFKFSLDFRNQPIILKKVKK